ncbi:hypothetical protein [Escherichia coli]|nr:hypothetical protein [Escherichia coli]
MSKKFKKKRKNEVKGFFRNGGEIKCIGALSDSEMSRFYI